MNNWKERFNTIFPERIGDIDVCESDFALNDKIKSFISETLRTQLEEVMGLIEKWESSEIVDSNGVFINKKALTQKIKDRFGV